MIKKCISMVAVLTCLVFLTACGSEQKTDAVQQQPAGQTEKIETGMTAPDMELVAFDGKKEKLSALYADGPVFMNFWASWCPPCVREMPDIERAYNAYGTKIHFVSVNLDTKREDAQAFWQKGRFTMPLYGGDMNRVGKDYHITGIPVSVLIDKGGKILDVRIGSMSGTELEAFLKPAVNK